MAEPVREDSASLEDAVLDDSANEGGGEGVAAAVASQLPGEKQPPNNNAGQPSGEEEKGLTQHEEDYSEAPIPSVRLFSAGKTSLSAGMILVPQHRIEWCMVIPSLMMVLSIVVALSCDELSVGEKKYYSDSYSSIKSTHYQCGWERQRISEHRNGGEIQSESIRYSEDSCEDYYGNGRCSKMERIGSVWLGMEVTCLTLACFSTFLVYKQGRRSVIFLGGSSLIFLLLMIGSLNYLSNQQCSKINNTSETSDSNVTNDIGASIIFDFVSMALAITCAVFSVVTNFFPHLDPRN